MIVRIPFRFPSLNEYVAAERSNLHAGAAMKKKWSEQAAWFFRGKPKIDKPVHVNFLWHEQTMKRDKDNVAFAKKFILDGMQMAQVLPNDNNRYISGFTDEFVYGKGDAVVVEVLEVG